jgi:trk system potassium uptake protein TrkH
MTLVYFGLKGNFKKIRANNEFLFYSIICLFFALLTSVILFSNSTFSFGNAILEGTFQVISIITTTGFYSHDFNQWGNLLVMIIFVLMFTGGSSGSTSGGIKIVRLLLIAKNSKQELNRIIHPNAFIPVRLDKRTVRQSTIYNLLIFIIIYFLTICAGALIITFMGCDLVTSFSTSASMLGNIGPGVGTFGPFTNYAAFPAAGKWILSGLMLIGRLELLTVMLLFSSNFYRNLYKL